MTTHFMEGKIKILNKLNSCLSYNFELLQRQMYCQTELQ